MDRPGRIMTEAAQAYSFSRRAFVLGTACRSISQPRRGGIIVVLTRLLSERRLYFSFCAIEHGSPGADHDGGRAGL
jgi:hypothetical protein